MGKVADNISEYVTLPYSHTICPHQSGVNIPVYCSKECALFTVQREMGKIVFVGCSTKWLALCHLRPA